MAFRKPKRFACFIILNEQGKIEVLLFKLTHSLMMNFFLELDYLRQFVNTMY